MDFSEIANIYGRLFTFSIKFIVGGLVTTLGNKANLMTSIPSRQNSNFRRHVMYIVVFLLKK